VKVFGNESRRVCNKPEQPASELAARLLIKKLRMQFLTCVEVVGVTDRLPGTWALVAIPLQALSAVREIKRIETINPNRKHE